MEIVPTSPPQLSKQLRDQNSRQKTEGELAPPAAGRQDTPLSLPPAHRTPRSSYKSFKKQLKLTSCYVLLCFWYVFEGELAPPAAGRQDTPLVLALPPLLAS